MMYVRSCGVGKKERRGELGGAVNDNNDLITLLIWLMLNGKLRQLHE